MVTLLLSSRLLCVQMRMPSSAAVPPAPALAYVGSAWPLSAGGGGSAGGTSVGRGGTPSYGASPYGKSVDMVDVCAQIMNSGALPRAAPHGAGCCCARGCAFCWTALLHSARAHLDSLGCTCGAF